MAYSPTTWVEGVTKLGPTNLNHLETGVQATAVVADAAIPKPGGPATNAGLVYNGSSWVAATLVNANIDAAAAIAYSKLNLAGSIVNNDIASGAGIVGSKLATGITGPPGTTIDYKELTSNVATSATTEGTATTILTANAVTFDGATTVDITFSCEEVFVPGNAGGNGFTLVLYEDGASIGKWGTWETASTTAFGNAVDRTRRRTPASGSRTYSARAYHSTAAVTFNAAAGGSGAIVPMYIKMTKV